MRNIVIMALTSALIIGLAGCGEKKEEKGGSQKSTTQEIKITTGAVKKGEETKTSKENTGQFYYSYNKEKNATDEESKRRTTLDAYLHIRSPYERVQIELMIKKLSKDFVIRCSPCHDDYANGVIGPSLLDKNGEFIYQRLIDFKTGKKKNVLMKQLVEMMDDAKLKSIANEIAEFNKQIQEMRKGRQ
ncbi:hypothetical protein [Hydrogenimonas sp.]|uniref:c-type cytochrome n=1 Tax=Hydrogenimonas sp. TaxID=2231112 RepID=UPI00262F1C64|nr:hypothetical protein [Hydrogenimonas sp.]